MESREAMTSSSESRSKRRSRKKARKATKTATKVQETVATSTSGQMGQTDAPSIQDKAVIPKHLNPSQLGLSAETLEDRLWQMPADETKEKSGEVKMKKNKKKSKTSQNKREMQDAILVQRIQPISIAIQSSSSRDVTLQWTKPKKLCTTVHGEQQLTEFESVLFEYQIIAENITARKVVTMYRYNKNSIKLPFSLIPGNIYSFNVSVRASRQDLPTQVPLCTASKFHRAVLVPWELNELLIRATSFVQNDKPTPVTVLYRNKPSSYFADIIQNRNGIMEVYDKDNSGDQGSPINGQILGLFFWY